MMSRDLLVIVFMGVATFSTRLVGLYIIGVFKPTPFVKRFLNYLPGCIISATVAPMVISGVSELITGIFVLVFVAYTGRLATGIIGGAILIYVFRFFNF